MKNIILITVDSLRADHLGCYGGEASTPVIDKLAKDGLLYKNCFANGPYTSLSVPTMLCSKYAPLVTRKTSTIAEEVSEAGYETFAVCPNVQLVIRNLRPMKLSRGFDIYDLMLKESRKRLEPLIEKGIGKSAGLIEKFGSNSLLFKFLSNIIAYAPLPFSMPIPDAEVLNKEVLRYLDCRKDEHSPFFLWLFYLDTHEPYLDPYSAKKFWSSIGPNRKYRYFKNALSEREMLKLHKLYIRELEYLDEQIGKFISDLEQRGYEDNIYIITADHGEQFGEHGSLGHPSALYDEQLRVPLIINGLGKGVSNDLIELRDIPPTILDMIGADTPVQWSGRSILDDIGKKGVISLGNWECDHFSYRTQEYKLIYNKGRSELYDILNDPYEKQDIYSEKNLRECFEKEDLNFLDSQIKNIRLTK